MNFLGPVWVFFLKLFNDACRALPSQQAISRMGRLLGGLTYFLQRKRRQVALNNLEMILGDRVSDRQRRTIARQSFDSVATTSFEMFWQPERHGIEFDQWARVEGLEHLQAAHAKDKGVIIACPHIGNWGVLGRALISHGYQMEGLMRPSSIPAVRAHIAAELGRIGITPTNTPLPPDGFKKIMERLAKGAAFLFVADRRVSDYLIDFLGHPAWTAHGAATMHLRSGAPIVTSYAIREKDHHRIIFEPAIEHPPTDDREADSTAILTEINQRFSAMILQHPGQWLWLHERWRQRRSDQEKSNPDPAQKPTAEKGLDAVNE